MAVAEECGWWRQVLEGDFFFFPSELWWGSVIQTYKSHVCAMCTYYSKKLFLSSTRRLEIIALSDQNFQQL